jgi:hypothetical protein
MMQPDLNEFIAIVGRLRQHSRDPRCSLLAQARHEGFVLVGKLVKP